MNYSILKKKINGLNHVKVISFDIFDTILKRIIPSEDVTKLSAIKLSELIEQNSNYIIKWIQIYKNRMQYSKESKSTGKNDWTIIEWLNHLQYSFSMNDEIINWGIEAELFAESLCVEPVKEIHSLLKDLRSSGYKIIATSDTWLDRDTLSTLLKNFGLYFDLIFSSGSLKKNKKTGELFKHIKMELGVKANQFLHIGDNLESDCIKPRLKGWNSIWTPIKHPLTGFWIPTPFHKGILKINRSTIICNMLKRKSIISDPLYKMAYENLAPLVALFSIIQHKRFRDQNIQAVFYIARDAHILYEAYNLMASYLKTDWQRFYIRLSRKAVAACHPNNPLINIKPIAGKTSRKNVNNWLGSFAIDDEFKIRILKKSTLKGHEPFTSETRKKLKIACDYYKCELDLFVSDSQKIIEDFLRQHFADGIIPERIGIIDSGWACTIQDCIANVLKDKIISGMYFGISYEGKSPDARSDKYGLIRDDFRNPVYCHPLQASAGVIRVWDTVLREDAGTASSLKRSEQGQVVPIIKADSSIGIEEQKACVAVSDGVMDGVNDRKKQISLLPYFFYIWDLSELESAANYFADSITIYPDKDVARKIIRLGFDEGIGTAKFKNLGLKLENRGLFWLPGILLSLPTSDYLLKIVSSILIKLLIIKRKKYENINCKQR